MSKNVFERDNHLTGNSSEKLYLDARTADVKFIFDAATGRAELILAHKAILSVGSPVFDSMFYGSLPERRYILILGASPGAFKEFLQFFYLRKVQLTAENIFQVANLCKKYELNDGLSLCEDPMKKTLTIDSMCSGYASVKLLEIENIVEYCEQQIKQKASEVLKSADFLECDPKKFDEILQLVSSECSASVIVNGCMAWAKAECGRKNVSSTPANLKVQLKGSFDRIRFDKLDSDKFSRFTSTYKQFFDENELLAIILKVMPKKSIKVKAVCDFNCISICFF